MLLISLAILYRNISPTQVSLYMQKRTEGEKLRGKIEFPGGKIEIGENPQTAASRELLEECQVNSQSNQFKLFKIYEADGEKHQVRLYAMLCDASNLEISKESVGQWYQLDVSQPLKGIEDQIMPANHQIIDDIVNYLSELSQI